MARGGEQNIIFMFGEERRRGWEERRKGVGLVGGPGSQKGFLAEELVTKLGFTLISTEDVVLTYLPNKVSNAVETTQEIQELLKVPSSFPRTLGGRVGRESRRTRTCCPWTGSSI